MKAQHSSCVLCALLPRPELEVRRRLASQLVADTHQCPPRDWRQRQVRTAQDLGTLDITTICNWVATFRFESTKSIP